MWKSVLIALAEGWLYAQAAVEPVLVAGRVNPPEQGQAIYGVAEDVFGRPLLLQGDRISRIERDLSTSHVVSGFPIQAELNTTALDRAGRLYFRTLTGIRRQELTGQISVVAGEGPLPAADGRGARDASFRADAMTVTAGGELRWLAGSSLWRIDEAGRLRRLWQDPGDGAIRRIPFFDSNAAAYLAEGRNIFSVDQDGMRPFRAVEGEVAAAAFRPTGELVYSLAGDGRILEQDRNGFTRVLAGRTAEGFAAGCPADGEGFDAGTARFEHIRQLFPQRDGGLLIYEWTTQRVRRLSPDHVLFPLTKNAFGRIGDGGLAAEAVLNGADDVAAGPDGLIYIADTNHNRIRRVRENGSIETVLGGTGAAACAEPLEYLLDRPKALAFLPSGDLLVVDSGNDRILRRTPDGRVFKFGTSDRFY
ncbi:MAG: hypothetical protein FJW30_24310, partial [Acidobacteria bacterium]|nr:hypothetical protein [Acidobacteriota bacterium]